VEKLYKYVEEANEALNQFLDGDDFEYQSTSFRMGITEHIQLLLEPLDNPHDIMSFECIVEYDGKVLSFSLWECDYNFKIYMK